MCVCVCVCVCVQILGYITFAFSTGVLPSPTFYSVTYVLATRIQLELFASLTRYDAECRIACLMPSWVSAASAQQRRGRAGRVQAGKCWHLFLRSKLSTLAEYQEPEIKRTPLEQLCLQVSADHVFCCCGRGHDDAHGVCLASFYWHQK